MLCTFLDKVLVTFPLMLHCLLVGSSTTEGERELSTPVQPLVGEERRRERERERVRSLLSALKDAIFFLLLSS